jgi:hypothetical protein
MGDRAAQLLEIADGQISELARLLSTRGNAVLTLPCPGRGKLGDGTVGATALHTADSYRRIAAFLQETVDARSSSHPASHGRHYRADNVDLNRLLELLSEAQGALSSLGGLSDERLDEVPPASETRFCDGQRTLEQVLTSLLRHQHHQIDALKAAVT